MVFVTRTVFSLTYNNQRTSKRHHNFWDTQFKIFLKTYQNITNAYEYFLFVPEEGCCLQFHVFLAAFLWWQRLVHAGNSTVFIAHHWERKQQAKVRKPQNKWVILRSLRSQRSSHAISIPESSLYFLEGGRERDVGMRLHSSLPTSWAHY